jgi:hypothetical protein
MAKGRRYATQDNCRQAIAWVLRELENDRMDAGKARAMIYGALSISGILSEHEVEKRIQVLETAMLRRPA